MLGPLRPLQHLPDASPCGITKPPRHVPSRRLAPFALTGCIPDVRLGGDFTMRLRRANATPCGSPNLAKTGAPPPSTTAAETSRPGMAARENAVLPLPLTIFPAISDPISSCHLPGTIDDLEKVAMAAPSRPRRVRPRSSILAPGPPPHLAHRPGATVPR